MPEILWGLRLRVPFELGVAAIHGSSVIRASSLELMGEKDLREEGSRSKHVPRPQAAEIGMDRQKLVNMSCQGEKLRLTPIEALSAREEAGNTTTSTRRADRHLAFIERWPETRRKGRRRRLSRDGGRRRKEKEKKGGLLELLDHSCSSRPDMVTEDMSHASPENEDNDEDYSSVEEDGRDPYLRD
ncbi:hypothetical protein JCGZ_24398 [Jatropha curcas]|uniref:Uncharacterized protein n=1 Tax=Jatropha curcas TaxID=180498 RepID=A0A067LEV7_JATCU|nr:hypothetical protein JCGZ_24398 [Jatropha curcas]